MIIWVIILIVQPFLYKYKKLALHRKIGKTTYVLVPLLLISAYFMMRLSYYRFIDQQTAAGTYHQQILSEIATSMALAFIYFFWLAILYSLAIINRRKSSFHARYMVATAFTLLGPTLDRLIWWIFKTPKLGGWLPIEAVSFLIIDFTLALLLWKDYRNQRSTKALSVALMIYLTVQILYFLLRKTDGWRWFVEMVM